MGIVGGGYHCAFPQDMDEVDGGKVEKAMNAATALLNGKFDVSPIVPFQSTRRELRQSLSRTACARGAGAHALGWALIGPLRAPRTSKCQQWFHTASLHLTPLQNTN